jgi:small subunit ribosomal protein S9
MVHKTVYLGTGRRKAAVARVRIFPGTGQRTINGRNLDEYFRREILSLVANQPFAVTETSGKFDLVGIVDGGGLTGQAGALALGIARALKSYDVGLKPVMDKVGLLTRDPRMKERKKYGQPGARKRFQFSKR